MTEKNFGHLGEKFQISLIKSLIEDKKFAGTIIEVLDPKYFDGAYFRYIVQNIKEFFTTFGKTPTYDTLAQKIMSENTADTSAKVHMDTLKNVQDYVLEDMEWVEKTAMKFCKQQVLKQELKVIEKIIENGKFEEYDTIEERILKALQIGSSTEDVRDAFFDVLSVLEKDSRVPIPLGIPGLDNLLKGGLARGELGVVLAPTGVGKTTLLTIFANSAYNAGFNVLHIFFEDNLNTILRKHYTIWTGISSDDQPFHKEEVIRVVKERELGSEGTLKLLKMPSSDATVPQIKSVIRKLKSEGFTPDLILIDYVDCISSEKATFGEEWKGEGNIMRHLESMTSEFDVGMWVATQGNRDSISSEVVMTDQMGGSIKKAQIGHVVISAGKTLDQKENKLATITLLKSRIGPDGIIFQNCKFDNEFLTVDLESQNTLLGHKHDEEEKKKNRATEAYKDAQERKAKEQRDREEKANNKEK